MRARNIILALLAVGMATTVGCSGPEKKLGRGLTNLTEFTRLGEIRRSVEQSAVWGDSNNAYTSGVIHGFNKSVVRTVVGAFEVLTFPIPGYGPYLKPGNALFPDMTVGPVYPDSYRPQFLADSAVMPDAQLGFYGGDVAPMIPGSRFRIFDY
jgi:putative exosortase-associated protein (TIGR04073 family)